MITKDPKVRYIKGYPDHTFRPEQPITREEVISLLYRLVVNEDKEYTNGTVSMFKDLDANSLSSQAIMYFYQNDLISGYKDGTFKPNNSITRAEFITIIAHFIPEDILDTDITFSDTKNHWASLSIQKATNIGWIKGYEDNTFKPDQLLTRAEVITIINRILNKENDDSDFLSENSYLDVPKNHWAYEEIMKASK